jgi:hypothetical protein
MTRSLFQFLLIIVVISTAGVGPALGDPVNTRIDYMNMNSSQWAQVTPSFYDSQGSLVFTGDPISTQPFGSGYVDLGEQTGLASGENYSVVLGSDQPLASICTRTDGATTDSLAINAVPGQAGSAYPTGLQGSSSMAPDCDLFVANPGGDSPQVTTNYYNADGTVAGSSYLDDLPPNGHSALNLPGLMDQQTLPDPFAGSAVVSSDPGPVCAVVHQRNQQTNICSYNGITQTGPTLHAPLIFNGFDNLFTSIEVQNPGMGTTTVTVTCGDNIQTPFDTVTKEVGPGATVTFPNDHLPSDRGLGATIESSNGQSIAAIVNVTNTSGGKGVYRAVPNGDSALVLPACKTNFDGQGQRTWCGAKNAGPKSGVGSGSWSVTLKGYNDFGNQSGKKYVYVKPGATQVFSHEAITGSPGPFASSVMINSNGMVAAAMVQAGPGGSLAAFTAIPATGWSPTQFHTGCKVTR